LIGSRVSHFRLLDRLGGEGPDVYRAEDLTAGSPVLLYCLVPETPETTGSDAVERFRRTALAAAALGHPNIAAVREIAGGWDEDAGDAGDGHLYLSLPSFQGETLAGRLERGPLALRDAFDFAAQIAAALARAHAAGIVHGGLSPTYVLVTPFGEVKVAAFGLGELLPCQAPEVRRGEPAGAAADVWSLGALLQAMIAGRHPFPAEALPGSYERIVARTGAHLPGERYPDAGPLEIDLLHAFAALEADSGRASSLAPTRSEIPAVSGTGLGAGVGSGVGGRSAAGGPAGPTPHGLAGRKLPSYRVFERLGSGGMAVVYRAEDIRLERMVALKFLAPELSRDPQAKDRFLREARAASSLDHPNICTVHEIGETDDGQIFLAMPFYGGETLAQRIARGPLPLDAALDIAGQIARGLAKAHRRGIVHRDIKPANVMLTPDGVVKIVDFGLAKLADSSGPRSGGKSGESGSGGGTIAYASPEQVRGESVDLRTDLWSLGVVLYEMVTGRKPFPGDQDHAVLFAIQRDAPRPPAELRPDVSPELAHVIGRLLAKDRDQRTSSAEAAAADLRALRGPETVGQAIAPPVRGPRWLRFLRPLRRRHALAAAGAAAALLAAALAWRQRGGEERAGPPRTSYVAVADQPGRMSFPSLSPDAGSLVYAVEKEGGSDIYWQRVGGETVQNLTAEFSGADTQPAFSPDGRTIVFRSEREGGGLFTMGATGESVRRISNFGYNPAWSPDGREVICATEEVANPGERGTMSQLWRIDLVTNARRRVPTGDAVQPSWSPHGWRIAYWGIPAGTSRRVIWTVPLAGGDAVPVVDDGALSWSPAWSPDGAWLYYASDRSGAMGLWRVGIDERSGRPRGAPQAVTVPVPSCSLPSLSRDGRHIAFATESPKSNLFLVPFDPVRRETAGPLRAVTQGSRVVRSADMSPDGTWIVFDTAEAQEDLYLVRRDGTGLRALTPDAARDRGPRWSPDGRRILFFSDRGGKYEAYTVRPDAPVPDRLTAISGEGVLEPLWAPDGRSLVYFRLDAGLALLDLAQPLAERRPRPLPADGQPPASFAVTSWSADGDWLAGYDDHERIVLYSFPARHYETLAERGQEVVWLRDGKTLLFLRGGAVWTLDLPSGAARRLLQPPVGLSFARLTVAPRDRALILVVAPSEGSIGMVTLR
jgi:serine/threonine protein kinase/Tol biopolymer transport system component